MAESDRQERDDERSYAEAEPIDTEEVTRALLKPEQAINDERVARTLELLGIRVPPRPEDLATDGLERDMLDSLEEKFIDSEQVYDGGFFTVDRVRAELPNGAIKNREIVRHPGAVGIIALDDYNRILLVNQYRMPLERVMLEIPAGKLEPGEDVTECARRELEEETGYTAETLKYFIPIVTAAGYSDEVIHLFIASGLKAGKGHPDDDEFIAVQWMELSELIDLVLDGRIEDSKTVIAALACDAIARRL